MKKWKSVYDVLNTVLGVIILKIIQHINKEPHINQQLYIITVKIILLPKFFE